MARLTGSSYAKITLAVLLALLLFVVLGLGSCVGWDMRFGKDHNEMAENVKVPTQGIKNIEIDWAQGSVDVIASDTNEIELIEYVRGFPLKAQPMRWSVSGDTLRVDYGNWLTFLSLSSKSLEVHIPKALAAEIGRLEIEGASGSYAVRGITCDTFKVHLASGELSAGAITAGRLDLGLASGHADVEGSFSESIRVDVASGKALVASTGACPQSIDADMASGRVVVAIPENDGFTVKIRKVSGSFQSDFETSLQSDSQHTYKNGDATFDVDIVSGSFSLEKAN